MPPTMPPTIQPTMSPTMPPTMSPTMPPTKHKKLSQCLFTVGPDLHVVCELPEKTEMSVLVNEDIS